MSKIESSYTRILLVLPSFAVSSLYVNQNPFNNFTPCVLDCNLYLIIDIKDYRLVRKALRETVIIPLENDLKIQLK